MPGEALQDFLAGRPELRTSERVAAVYAQLPSRERQPSAHAAHVRLWTLLVADALQLGLFAAPRPAATAAKRAEERRLAHGCGLATFAVDASFERAFVRFGHRPLGLGAALQAWMAQGDLVAESTLLERAQARQLAPGGPGFSTGALLGRAWAAAASTADWIRQHLVETVTEPASSLPSGVLVCQSVVQQLSQQLWPSVRAELCETADCWMDLDELLRRLATAAQALTGTTGLSDKDAGALLLHWAETGVASIFVGALGPAAASGTLHLETFAASAIVRLWPAPEGSSQALAGAPDMPLAAAVDLVRLKRGVRQLQAQASAAQTLAADARDRARQFLRESRRTAARTELLRARQFDGAAADRAAALDNLDRTLFAVRQAHSNAQVLRALDAGRASLKAFHTAHGLSADRVARVLDDWADLAADVDQVSDLLAHASASGTLIDDDVLEAELEALVEPRPSPVVDQTELVPSLERMTVRSPESVRGSSRLVSSDDRVVSSDDEACLEPA